MKEPAPFPEGGGVGIRPGPRWVEYETSEEFARASSPIAQESRWGWGISIAEQAKAVQAEANRRASAAATIAALRHDPLPTLCRTVDQCAENLKVSRGRRDRLAQRLAEAHADVGRAADALKAAEEALRQAGEAAEADRRSRSVRVAVPESGVVWTQTMSGAEGRAGLVSASCSRYGTLDENRAEVLRMLRAAGAVQ
jgi:hypothetical protein